MHLSAQGYQVFVLQYSLGISRGSLRRLCDAAWAMRLIRGEAKRFCVDPHKVAVMGFSAGGYVAAGLSVFAEKPSVCPEAAGGNIRPDAAVLCYPVLTACRGLAHEAPSACSLGKRRIRRSGAPSFHWKTISHASCRLCFMAHGDDKSVDVQNSLLFASALAQNGAALLTCMFLKPGASWLADCSLRTCDKAHPYPAHWLMLAQEWLGQRWA